MAFQQDALRNYNTTSNGQLSMILPSVSVLLNQLRSIEKSTSGSISLVDYGCSEGYNSMIFLKKY